MEFIEKNGIFFESLIPKEFCHLIINNNVSSKIDVDGITLDYSNGNRIINNNSYLATYYFFNKRRRNF